MWRHYGFTPEMVAAGDFNAQMFNSFLDGTKSAIEMAAVANATGLTPAPDGLAFPPCGVDDLPRVLRPRDEGGLLHHAGQVEVISSLERDGRPVFRDLRWGVYVTFRAGARRRDYVRRCFARIRLLHRPVGPLRRDVQALSPDRARARHQRRVGRPARRSRPARRRGLRGDVVATAKRDLAAGETLDGEGGFTVYGKLHAGRAIRSRCGGLPLGLAHGVKLVRDIAAGALVRWDDVAFDAHDDAVQLRREMEASLRTDVTDESVEAAAPHRVDIAPALTLCGRPAGCPTTSGGTGADTSG